MKINFTTIQRVCTFFCAFWCFSIGVLHAEHITLPSKNAVTLLTSPSTKRIILDIRTPEEFASGHIAGAQNINFFSADFEKKIAQLDKNAHYVIYCRTNGRSSVTFERMKELGFKNVVCISDGMNGWKAQNLPVEK